jgi:hypothetical protein
MTTTTLEMQVDPSEDDIHDLFEPVFLNGPVVANNSLSMDGTATYKTYPAISNF